jgi:hypothetical protein
MTTTKRNLLTAALTAVLVLPAVAPAAAQSRNKSNVNEVEIWVRDAATRQEIGTVRRGGTIDLPEGARVRITMRAFSGRNDNNPAYPATEFSDPSRGGVRIVRSREDNSNADIEILGRRNSVQTINYRITDTWVPSNLRTGSFRVRVVPGGTNLGSTSADCRNCGATQNIANSLYQGILMRAPDDAGLRTTLADLDRGGWDEATRIATLMANSDESRRLGVSNETRLQALYSNLLGVSPNNVDRTQWNDDLRRLNNGELARVVENMVRSERFRSRWNWNASTRY